MRRRRSKATLVDLLNAALRADDRRAPAVRIPKANQPPRMPTRTGEFRPVRQGPN